MDEHEPRHRPHNTSSTGPRAGLLKLPGRRSDATNRFGSIRALLFGLSFTFDNSPADSLRSTARSWRDYVCLTLRPKRNYRAAVKDLLMASEKWGDTFGWSSTLKA
jgi:hypothetical protein